VTGARLARRASASASPGWYYDRQTDSVVVSTGALSTGRPATVTASGTRSVDRAEPGAGLS
jgi:hypothetical protein